MSESSIHSILNASFPKSGKEQWLRAASQELGNQNQIENLIWKIGGLNFYPYYEEEDLQNLAYLKNYQTSSKEGGWQNLPKIKVVDEKHANERALASLTLGANGVLFDVTDRIDFNINRLLEGITWPYCTVSFLAASDTKIVTKIFAYAEQKKYQISELKGSIFWQTLSSDFAVQSSVLSAFKNYHVIGIFVPRSSPVEEISKSLQQGVKMMDTLTDLGIEKEIIFNNISLSFPADEKFLINIAKIKAIRMLWYQLSQAFEIRDYNPGNLYIHVYTENLKSVDFQPHGYMIKNTTDGLSAVIGGCNALTLVPDESNAMTDRVSLHISNILKEESHLDKVSNAVGGAYAIENIVNELARAAWHDFQNKMSL